MYIHQRTNWIDFRWDNERIISPLGAVRHLQGRILGKMMHLGFPLKSEAIISTLTLDVLKSTEIEGELLNPEQVRSSVARHLGLETLGMVESSGHVEGIVKVMTDATQNFNEPLTNERLFGWHAALFPTGYSGMYKIEAGRYRTGAMQVVSGAMGKEKVHYEAPPAQRVDKEMKQFLDWFNAVTNTDPVIKSAIAHFWFVTIHPFDDGNGRIARAIADMQLARSDSSRDRFYSMSNQILKERKKYYDILEKSQHGNSDITKWLEWFLKCLHHALLSSEETLEGVLSKANFWNKHKETMLNERQRLILNKLLDDFEGKLSTTKYAKLAKTSQDTALRDIRDLIDKGILQKETGGGRSTNYDLVR